MGKSVFAAALALILAFACSGCVERAMVITSEPSGADVVVNQQWRGKTPYVLPFKHYGVYDIWLEHPGYEENGKKVKFYPMHVAEPVKAPGYQYAGADFVTEVMLPTTIRDQRDLHYVLERVSEADDLSGVLDRAAQMREASLARREMRQAKDDDRRTPTVKPPFLPQRHPGSPEEAPEPESGGYEAGGNDYGDYQYSESYDYVPGTDIDPTPPDPNQVPVFTN